MPETRANLHRELVELLRARSVHTGSFTLSSGRRSSFYIDARLTTMAARGLELIGSLGLAAIRARGWRPQAVGGLTLGADPVAYAIAMATRASPPTIDAFTVRKTPKNHGTGSRIEGCLPTGSGAVVIVEDVITTGASALAAVEAVREAGANVVGVLAVVDRAEGGRTALEQAGLPVTTLVTLADLGLDAPT